MIRRRTLLGAGSLLAAPALLRPARAAGEPLEVCGIYSLSGTFANVGDLLDKGSRLAVEHWNSLDGRPVKYTLLDDQGDPGRSVRLVQEAMGRGVRHFIGCTNSAIALAVMKELADKSAVYVNVAGADEVTGKDCTRQSFRWPVASYSAVNATMRPMIKANPRLKRWYTITGQYVFGDSLLSNTKAVLKELGCQHVGNSYHSLSEREYSGYITAAIAAQPDALAICNFGNQTVDVLRQAVSFGMKRNTKILVQWSTGLDQFQAAGAEVNDGVYFGVNYWHEVQAPGNTVLSQAMEARYHTVPGYLQACGWAAAQVLFEGVLKAGSTDPARMIPAMDGMKYQGVTGEESVRPQDHQVIKPYYLMLGKAKAQMRNAYDFATVESAEEDFLPPDRTGCHMAA